MLIPVAGAVHIAIERDLAVARDGLELVDDLSANRTQISGLGLDGNTRAFSFSSQIEEVSDDVLNAMHSAFDDVRVLLGDAGRLGDELNPSGGEQNCVERVADIVTDDRE